MPAVDKKRHGGCHGQGGSAAEQGYQKELPGTGKHGEADQKGPDKVVAGMLNHHAKG